MLDTTYLFDGSLSAAGVPTGAAITTTRVSTNTLNLLTAVDMAVNGVLKVRLEVLVALTGGTSLQVSVQGSNLAAGTYYTLVMSPVYPAAQLIAGAKIFDYDLPVNQLLNGTAGILNVPAQYLQLSYTVVGTFTGGTVFGGLVPRQDKQELSIYPANYSVNTNPQEV